MLTSFSELIDYHVETFFSENSSHVKKSESSLILILHLLYSLKSFLVRSFKSEERSIKIFSINREAEKQLQKTAALRFFSSVLTFNRKSDFQFSKFYVINRALEPNIPSYQYAAMI